MNRLLIILSTYMFIINIHAQDIDYQDYNVYDIINEISEDELSEQDINNLENNIQQLKDSPIDINSATKKDFERIPFLNDRQIESIMYYLYLYAPVKSVYELLYIDGIDRNLFNMIIPFVYAGDYKQVNKQVVNNRFKKVNTAVLTTFKSNINRKEGYVEKRDTSGVINRDKSYVFNRLYNNVRINIEQKNRFRLGLTVEKDAGEKWGDFFSGYLQFMPRGIVRNVIIGNYKSRLGMGLIMNNGFSMGKGFYTSGSLSRMPSFSGHNSTDEYSYLQGAIVEAGYSRLLLTLLISYRRFDGISDDNSITSIKKDGLHSKVSDLEKIDKVSLLTSGVSLIYDGNVYKCGLNMVSNVFNNDFLPALRPYNVYYFRGDRQLLFSLYNKVKFSGFDFSSEVAGCVNDREYFKNRYSFSTINSLSFYFTGKSGLSFIQRYYQRDFNSFWGRSYSESSSLQNEQGYSVFCYFPVFKDAVIKTGIDVFSFPFIKYGIDSASKGYDLFFKLESAPVNKMKINLSYRFKRKYGNEKSYSGDTLFYVLPFIDSLLFTPHDVSPVDKHQGYIALSSNAGNIVYNCMVGGNILVKGTESGKKSGVYLTSMVGYQKKNFPLSGNISFTAFSTDDYSSRVYITERGMPYSFGFNSLYGEGMRIAVNIKYDIIKRLTVWIKFSNTHYFDTDTIGTGFETIYGSDRTDVSAMIRYKF